MKKLLLAAVLITGFALVGINTPVTTGQQHPNVVSDENGEQESGIIDSYLSGFKEIKLQVVGIKDNTLKLQDEKGKIHSFKVVDRRMLKRVQVGDTVKVKIEKREG
ncbi:MAG TPA: hypothetical protein VNN20_07825 [Thermodesulfobacteriota bacterium]|nr:hypothetical protein [Thermodesulfobacteriota bacterium]